MFRVNMIRCRGAQFYEAPEDVADRLGLLFVGHEAAVPDIVAQRRHAAYPHPPPWKFRRH